MSHPDDRSGDLPSRSATLCEEFMDFYAGLCPAKIVGTDDPMVTHDYYSLSQLKDAFAAGKAAASEPTPVTCPDTQQPCNEFCYPHKGDRCARTNATLSAIPSATGWRKADEYKPEHGQEVLIYHCLGDARRSNHAFDVAWWFGIDKGWTFPWDRDGLPIQKPMWVVAWMPLPEAPK